MTPDSMIADLDRGLLEAGETVRLQRLAAPAPPVEVTLRAIVRGYAPNELIAESGITQQDQKFIFSPTEITAANWPGTAARPPPGDRRVPRQGDRVISSRGVLTVQNAVGLYVAGALVRIEAQARGT